MPQAFRNPQVESAFANLNRRINDQTRAIAAKQLDPTSYPGRSLDQLEAARSRLTQRCNRLAALRTRLFQAAVLSPAELVSLSISLGRELEAFDFATTSELERTA